ncbi:MAG: ABC transporter ATP-binding protein [Betaproteobacteria bacterium]
MTAAVLEVRGLTVEFATRRGVVRAVEDLSLTIGEGEVLGVVGESGAGKSLTGTAVLGLLEPPARIGAGEIWLGGERIDHLPPARLRRLRGRHMGAIFQDPLTALDPLFTVGDQLEETIRAHLPASRAEARARAVALLAETGVPAPERRMDQYPHQLSGGLRQRVVIALALCAEPRLVIADEPTTALDVSTQAQIIALLKRITRAHGTAVMLVTHDMGVIAETADRVAVLYAGRVVESGPVRQVLHAPRHPYTAGLMASIPRLGAVGARLAQIDGAMPRPGALPPGCAFHPRCPKAMQRCREERPPAVADAASQVACWLAIAPAEMTARAGEGHARDGAIQALGSVPS